MSLLWIDGFDHYNIDAAGNIGDYADGAYDFIGSTNSAWRIETMPVLGGLAFRKGSGDGSFDRGALEKNLPADYSSGSIGVGYHIYIDHEGGSDNMGLVSFSTAATWRYWIRKDSTGLLHVCYGTGTNSEADSGANTLQLNTLYHIEVKLVIAGSGGGSIEVRVNGDTWINHTGITTDANAINRIGIMPMWSVAFPWRAYFDNLYFWDSNGTENNDWLGERRVYTLLPDGDGASQDWTPASGTDGFDMINDVPADGGTNYVESTTVGDVSTFAAEALPSTSIVISGVQTVIQGTKTGTDPASVSFGPEGAGNTAESMTQDQLLYFSAINENNPATGLPWTPAEVNALVIELERTE